MGIATKAKSLHARGDFDVTNLSVAFGGLKAVSNFNLHMEEGSLHGLIGPNGAGKTTVFNLITSVYRPDHGDFLLGGVSLKGRRPHEIAQSGLARTFQSTRLFKDLTVLQNVLVSYHFMVPYHYWDAFLRTKRFWDAERHLEEDAFQLLSLFGLEKRADQLASSLPYGDQRRLEIARALAVKPRVLFLDEPAAGLNSSEKVELMKTIGTIRNQFQLSILVIEHDMKLVMGVCEHITVLDHGETIAKGTPRQIQENSKVIEAYLGVA